MEINTLKKTKEILNKYNLRANKRFGQNFLIDDNTLKSIVEKAELSENDLVIEIGPGLGNLTQYLLEEVKYCILVEIDDNMIDVIRDRFKGCRNFTLINEDILKINLNEEVKKIEEKLDVKFNSVKVVANLPYYITTPIIFKLLQGSSRIDEIVVMVQKEVANRMVSSYKTKDYGILSIMVQYFADSEILIKVPNSSFIPSPKVESAVVKLIKRKKYIVKNEEILFELIHSSFANRRKKMINSLEISRFRGMPKDKIKEMLINNGYSELVRAEELKLEDFIKIADSIS